MSEVPKHKPSDADRVMSEVPKYEPTDADRATTEVPKYELTAALNKQLFSQGFCL